MAVYSFSQIWVYQQCPKKYQFQYVDKLEKEFKSSPDLILWTSVHVAFEWLYQQVSLYKLPKKEDVLNKFHEIWNKEITEAWDELLYKWEQKAEDYINRWEHYIDHYYNQYYPFDQAKLIWTEVMLTFNLNPDWWEESKKPFRWFIDRLDKEPWDIFVINDYKTNKNLPTADDTEYKEQLTLYGLWVKQKYWDYIKWIKARLHYLNFDFDEPNEWDITDDILNPVVEKYSKLVEEIEVAKAKYAESFNNDKNAFPTKANNFCRFCEYQNLCPLFLHMNYWDEIVWWWSLWENSVKKLVDRYAEICKQASELDKEKSAIKDVLVEYANEKGFEQLFGNESDLWLSSWINYSVKNKEWFVKYLKDNWLYDKATDIPYYKINSLVKDWELPTEVIDEYLEWNESRRLTPRKKKENKKDDI